MKKRILCLVLAALTVVSCMVAAGCSANKNEEVVNGSTTDDSALTTVTLTLWIPTDKSTTEEAILAVQEAINKITKAKFETAIELHAIPSDEYEAAVNARITEIEEKKAIEAEEAARKKKEAKELAAKGITTEAVTTAVTERVTEETYINDMGMTVVRYPEVEDTQMDIFLVRSYKDYTNYVERKALSALDNILNSTSKILKQYIYPSFLDYVKVRGSTYAIPNNRPVGEVKYLLINKRLVDELYWNPDDLKTLLDCKQFILDVKQYTDVTPLLSTVENSGMVYFSEDGSFSLLGARVKSFNGYSDAIEPTIILGTQYFNDTYKMMKEMREQGCVAADPSTVTEFGVGVIAGSPKIEEEYGDDYYVRVYDNPTFTTEDIFGSMFAVSAYTKSLNRSMEVLTLLNTDTTLRTILQYGVEDIHWKINDDNPDVIDVISSDYIMNLNETGNVYMTYPAPGVSMDEWKYGKEQNLLSKVSPFLMFTPDVYITEENAALYEQVKEYTKKIWERMEAMTSVQYGSESVFLMVEIKSNPAVAALLDKEGEGTLWSLWDRYARRKG